MKKAQHLINEDGTHDPMCFPCKLQSVSFAPSAMPTRSPEASRAKYTDPALEKDRDAYRRLRRDGTQPITVKGSAKVEKEATEKFEIDTGRIVSDPAERRQYAQAFSEMPKPNPNPIVRDQGTKKSKPRPVEKREKIST